MISPAIESNSIVTFRCIHMDGNAVVVGTTIEVLIDVTVVVVGSLSEVMTVESIGTLNEAGASALSNNHRVIGAHHGYTPATIELMMDIHSAFYVMYIADVSVGSALNCTAAFQDYRAASHWRWSARDTSYNGSRSRCRVWPCCDALRPCGIGIAQCSSGWTYSIGSAHCSAARSTATGCCSGIRTRGCGPARRRAIGSWTSMGRNTIRRRAGMRCRNPATYSRAIRSWTAAHRCRSGSATVHRSSGVGRARGL
jgi:hypothetical protein